MVSAIQVTAFDIAERFIGVREVPGIQSNPMVLAMLRLDDVWPETDAVPWCSAFVNYVAWLLRLPRSKSLRARSWLGVGRGVGLMDAAVGFDVVVLKRLEMDAGPERRDLPGHVGFYAGAMGGQVLVLGGNQGNAVSVQPYSRDLLLGVRRLA